MSVAGALSLHDVQGGILHGYGAEHAAYLVVEARTAEALRACLADVVDRVTTAVPCGDGPPVRALNVALTFPGFARLGLPVALLDRFPVAFREGPVARAPLLGDVGDSAPERWDDGLGTGRAHLLLSVHAATDAALQEEVDHLHALVARSAGSLRVLHVQPARALSRRREHFGYADGFAQPHVEGVVPLSRRRTASADGGGVPMPGGRWRPVRLGEFLLGHEDEDGQVARAPHPLLVRNGTYVVYRKLFQDVARFRRSLAAAAAASRLHPELVAAKWVGRWRNGLPLELVPTGVDGDDLEDQAEGDPPNDFRYLPHDADGYRCPRGAHIRRVNPRDALGFDGLLTARHRMIRRGMPYGEPLPAGQDQDDEVDRGLVFVCCVGDLERQFETVQQEWCNDGDPFGLGDDRDPLVGGPGGSGKMTIPVHGSFPRFVGTPPVVLTRGAEYLFAPGLGALRRLAAGTPWDPR